VHFDCRSFSTTSPRERISTQRKNMYLWLNRHGKRFEGQPKHPSNYLGPLPNQPFPMNPLFRSQPVLNEEVREQIWHNVIVMKESLKAVSAVFNVDVRRVAAVVRMKEIEKMWQAEVRLFVCLWLWLWVWLCFFWSARRHDDTPCKSVRLVLKTAARG